MESLSFLGSETDLVVMTTSDCATDIRNNLSTSETPTGSCNSSTSEWELHSTEQAITPAPPIQDDGKVPLIGYPGPVFTAIHGSALTSLSLSTVTVSILLIYLCGFSGSVKDQVRGTKKVNGKGTVSMANKGAQTKKVRVSFWRWNVGERFVVYLGAVDLMQGISHFLDHAYMLYAKDSPPDRLCKAFAFFLHGFVLSQFFVVVTTAVSACSLIVFGRKMSLGRRDWRFFAFAFGTPTLITIIAESRGLLGASGAWCFVKYGAQDWLLYTQFQATFQITAFGLVGFAYGAIWIKIQRTTQLMKGSTTERYQSSAKVMLVFVGVFILQWWSFTLYNIWALVTTPPAPVLVLAVIIINLGGIYNAIAYTIIRRKLQSQRRQNAVTSGGNNITNTTTDANSSGAAPPRVSGGSRVPIDKDVLPDVLDNPGYNSRVSQAWSVPAHPDSDAGEKQDAGPVQIHIHI